MRFIENCTFYPGCNQLSQHSIALRLCHVVPDANPLFGTSDRHFDQLVLPPCFRYEDDEIWTSGLSTHYLPSCACLPCRSLLHPLPRAMGGDFSMTWLEHSAYLLEHFPSWCFKRKDALLIVACLPASLSECCSALAQCNIRIGASILGYKSMPTKVAVAGRSHSYRRPSSIHRFTPLLNKSTNQVSTTLLTRLRPASLQNDCQGLPTAS